MFNTFSIKVKIAITLLTVFILAAGMYGFYYLNQTTPQFNFNQNQKVTSSADLYLIFENPMDRESVEKNLEIPPNISGDLKWMNDHTLIFKPTAELTFAETYIFTINQLALLTDGNTIGKDLKFKFVVSSAPILSLHVPAKNSMEVPDDAKITLIFDRPVVPLSIVHSKKNPENWPIKISPETEGRWRWLGTTTAKFIPKEPLLPATKYTVYIPEGIEMLSGDKTLEDFSFDFSTILPRVIDSVPNQGRKGFGPDEKITLYFNMPINLESAKEKISLVKIEEANNVIENNKAIDPPEIERSASETRTEQPQEIQNIHYGIDYAEMKESDIKTEDKSTLIIKLAKNLELGNKNYKLKVAQGIRGILGEIGSDKDHIISFQTAGAMTVEGSDHYYNNINLTFSNPLKEVDIKDKISIFPEVEGWDTLDFKPSTWNKNYLHFYPQLKPSTSYTLRVDQDVRDIWGQNLPGDYTMNFTTDPIDPRVFIKSKGDFGIFEKDKAPIYYINSVNVSRLDMEFAKLELADFLEIRRGNKQSYNQTDTDLSKFSQHQKWSLPPKKNLKDEWEVMPFNLNEESKQKLEPGIYAFSLKAPEYKQTWGDRKQIIDYQYFALTNIGLTLKYSGGKALVWAVDLQSGEAVDGAHIAFHSLYEENIISGKTDSEGFFETAIDLKKFITENNDYQPEFWVTAKHKDDFAFIGSNWSNGLHPYSFGISSDFKETHEQEYKLYSYIYTERPIYRSGDTVHFKGIVRMLDSEGVFYPPNKKRQALLKVSDPKGNEIYNETLDFTEFGSFSDEIPIDEKAALGDYSIQLQVTPETEMENNYASSSFAVLAYRKPEYKVEVDFSKKDYFDHDIIKASIDGSYYFGGALSDAKIEWRTKTTDYFFNKYTDDWYSFALEESWCWWDCERNSNVLSSGTGKLNSSGHFDLEFPVDISDKGVGQVITVEADIYDPNNQVVSNRVSVPVHKSEVYVGINSEDYSVQPGTEAAFNVITLGPDGKEISDKEVELKLFQRTWNSIRKKSVDGEYYFDNEAKDELIDTVKFRTGKNGKAIAKITIPSGGQFRAIARVKDSKRRASKAGTSIYAWSSTYINWPHKNNDKIEIIADKPEYKVGETANFLVKSPFQGKGVKALLTVERENVISKKVIDVQSNSQVFEVPVTEDLIPNAYVSVVIIKAREGETFNEHGLDTGSPSFKMGYKKILVETEQKELNMSLKTDKKKYGPGETVTVHLKATDFFGKPLESEFSLGVVDMSVLALTGFQMPDLMNDFYNERRLGVRTSEMLTYFIERFKPGSKGGGGADPESKKRGNFRDTAYWNPNIITDENGKAEITFQLPDNLTTWKLLAIANTKDSKFGAVAEEIVETKKVILRPVRPRFAVADDEILLGAIVHNFMDTDKEFNVSLSGEGFSSEEKREKKMRIKANEKIKVNFPIKIEREEKVVLNFKAETQGARDEIEETIPVFVFGTPQSVASSGFTENIATEVLSVPSKKDAPSGDLEVSISPSLASYLPKGLEYLVHFPYGCAEQTVSSFLPNIVVNKLQGFEAFKISSDEELSKNIIGGLERLYAFQRYDGGFGYWENSYTSHPYLSAYILFALNETKKSGFAVDSGVIDKTKDYLNSILRNQNLKNPIDLATRAYILFVLAESGDSDINLLSNLYEKRIDLAIFSKAHLAMAFQKTDSPSGKKKAKELTDDILSFVKIEARGAHFEENAAKNYRSLMNTNSRTTAIALQSLIRVQPENELIPKVVRYLLAIRENGHWDTTQSTTLSILSLIEFLQNTQELDGDMIAGVEIAGKKVLDQEFNSENILTRKKVNFALEELARGKENKIKIGKEGTGRIYYDLLFSYFYTADEIYPAEEGFGIIRELLPLDSKNEEDILSEVKIAETYKVKLTITVPEDRHFVAVESPLPAGMEIIDTRLKTSQQNLLEDEVNECENNWSYECWSNNLWRFNHKEFRDDKVFLFADYLPTGVYEYEYLVRATTPGNFKLRPARVWEMYFPETFGQTEGSWFRVKEEDG